MNQITIVGNLGKDAELRTTQSSISVLNFSVATDDGFYDKQKQEYINNTNWHSVTVWRKVAEANKNLKKGDKVLVSGRLTYNTWEKDDGTKVTKAIIEAYRVEKIERREIEKESQQEKEPGINDDLPF